MEEELARAEEEMRRLHPGYLEKVRRAVAERGTPPTPLGRAKRAVDVVSESAHISPNVPLESRRPAGRALKQAVSSVTRFYFLHMSAQMSELGHSSAWMGSALIEYVEQLERRVEALEARIGGLGAGTGQRDV